MSYRNAHAKQTTALSGAAQTTTEETAFQRGNQNA